MENTMEDQATYAMPHLRWHVKQTAPLTKTAEAILAEWQTWAADSAHAPLTDDEMAEKITNGVQFTHATNLGYFYGTIHGPKGYLACALYTTPYNVPLLLLEKDPDYLQPSTTAEGGDQ